MKWIIRLTAAATVVVFAALSYVQLTACETEYPLGSTTSVALVFSDSGLSKTEAVAQLGALGATHRMEILLVAPSREEPSTGRDIYSLGADQPSSSRGLNWLAWGRTGTLRPAAELGATSLSGTYGLVVPPRG